MSNGNLQRKQVADSYTDDAYLEDSTVATQALILGAYLEEKKKWEDTKYNLSLQIADIINSARLLSDKLRQYSRLKLKAYKLFGIKTKEEKELLKLKDALEVLSKEMSFLMENPPNPNTYELAMMGNLFRAR